MLGGHRFLAPTIRSCDDLRSRNRKRPMENLKAVDVAIVGGGWTGLMMAKEITTRTGLNVAVLERGIPRKTSDYALDMDELDYAVRLRMIKNIADKPITP